MATAPHISRMMKSAPPSDNVSRAAREYGLKYKHSFDSISEAGNAA